MIRALKIPVDGTIEVVEFKTARSAEDMAAAIGCRHIERVRVDDGWALLVDEDGLFTGHSVNERASILYGVRVHGTPIVGDVLLMREGMTGSGESMGIDWLDSEPEMLHEWFDREVERRQRPNLGR